MHQCINPDGCLVFASPSLIYLDPSCILSNAEENIPFQHPVRKPCSRVTHLHEDLLDERHL